MKYDAFIAYSRRADASLAKALHDALSRSDTSLFGFRRKRIFSDVYITPAGKDLPTQLSEALERSKYLILLASPESAQSRSVELELSIWLANRPLESLIVVLTGGEVLADTGENVLHPETTNALPTSLKAALSGRVTPYIDLRWTRQSENFEQRYQFLDAVARIAGIIEGVSRDAQLNRYALRQVSLRRAMFVMLILLAVLVIAIGGFAFFAFDARNKAYAARNAALQERDVARRQRVIAEQAAESSRRYQAQAEDALAHARMLERQLAELRHRGQIPSLSRAATLEGDLADAEADAADYKQKYEDATKLADQYKQQYEAQSRISSELTKGQSQMPRNSYFAELIKQNLTSVIVAAILIVFVILFSTRLVLLLLQLDIGLLKPIAIAFFYTPFGKWKLYRKYKKRLREDATVHYHAEHYVDVPFESSNFSAADQSLEQNLKWSLPQRNLCITAGGGQGKTTLAYKFALLTVDRQLRVRKRTPVPVIVDGLTYDGNLLEAITSTLTQHGVYANSAIVGSQVTAGHILVILDGWSEVREFYSKPEESSDIPKFITAHPDTRFIFTSRADLPATIQHALMAPVTVKLKELDEQTLEAFLLKYLERRREEVPILLKELKGAPNEIPLTPLMIRLVAEIYDRTGQVPADRISLFDQYVLKLFRPEIIGKIDMSGLLYVVKHLVRNTYIASDGDRGFSIYKGVELIEQIKVMVSNFGIQLLPIDLLRLLANSGLYRRSGEYFRFFHDSFESYFAAQILDDDFREGKHELLARCASNVRFIEAIGFLIRICKERNEEEKLVAVIEQARKAEHITSAMALE